MRYSVLVVTADPTRGHRLRSQITEAEDLEVAEALDSSTDVLDALARTECHVLVVDESIAPVPALEVVREVQSRLPHVAVLVLSAAPNPQQLEEVVDAGGRGIVAVSESFEETRRRLVSAGEWSLKIRSMAGEVRALATTAGQVLTLVGGKGGVGTTTVAVHLVTALQQFLPAGARICLVDLDLAKGDLPSLLAVSPRRDLSDLVGLGTALSTQVVQDIVFAHPSGLHVVCAPSEPERAEEVDGPLVRAALGALRQLYDVIVVDAGSAITDTLAMAVEVADEVVVVCTPDVPAIRGVRRLIDTCERLSLRSPDELRVLLTHVDNRSQIQPGAVTRMVPSPLCSTTVPAAYRRLEPAANFRDPARVRDRGWQQAFRSLAEELLGTWAAQQQRRPAASSDELEEAVMAESGRGRLRSLRRGGRADSGVITVEFLALTPLVLLILALCLQGIVYAAAAFQAREAAAAAAHAAARGGDAVAAAQAEVSDSFAGALHVGAPSDDGSAVRVTVRVDVPRSVPLPFFGDLQVSSTSAAVAEDVR